MIFNSYAKFHFYIWIGRSIGGFALKIFLKIVGYLFTQSKISFNPKLLIAFVMTIEIILTPAFRSFIPLLAIICDLSGELMTISKI